MWDDIDAWRELDAKVYSRWLVKTHHPALVRRSCTKKIAYDTYEQANDMRVYIDPKDSNVYKCNHCTRFHWGHFNKYRMHSSVG